MQLILALLILFISSNSWAVTPANQDNWRIYQNKVGEPVNAYAAENAAGTLLTNSDVTRIRIAMHATIGANMVNMKLQYSTDNSTWSDLGSGNAWNWSTTPGGTDGGTVTSLLLSDTTADGIYLQSSGNSPALTSSFTEYDAEIKPTASVSLLTLYYFQVVATGVSINLSAGATHPQIYTTNILNTPAIINNGTINKSGGINY